MPRSRVGAHRGVRAADRRILWCSPSYGYEGDLMYFRPIFLDFVKQYPKTRIAVSRTFPVNRYPELPLWPVLDLKTVNARFKPGLPAHAYSTGRLVPTPASIARLTAFDADLYVLIEFTPVALIGFMLSRIRHRRALLLVESHPRYRGGPDGALARMVKTLVARRADHVLVSNEEAADYVGNALGVRPERLSVGPYLTSAPAEARTTPQQ